MSHSILKFFVVAAVMILAVLLFTDSTTFALQKGNPLLRRGRGCYMELEILLGVKQPTVWVRFIELAAVGILGVSGIAGIITWRRSE